MTPSPASNTLNPPAPLTDPAAWWRVLCHPLPDLVVSGDLGPPYSGVALERLQSWRAAGITDIVDARGEWSDEEFVAEHAPEMAYHWVGTHDDGSCQSDSWFDVGVAPALEALREPGRRVLVHCHMGVNRGPSLAFAVMLALGHTPIAALEAIRTSRPIAAVLYAEDAVRWWHRRSGGAQGSADAAIADVRAWMTDHPLDTGWVISRLACADD